MIQPTKIIQPNIIKGPTTPVVQFFSKSSSPLCKAENTGKLNSFVGLAILTSSFFYFYKKYKIQQLQQGKTVNVVLDNTVKGVNKKINKAVYNTSKVFEKNGLKSLSKVLKKLIFKV